MRHGQELEEDWGVPWRDVYGGGKGVGLNSISEHPEKRVNYTVHTRRYKVHKRCSRWCVQSDNVLLFRYEPSEDTVSMVKEVRH